MFRKIKYIQNKNTLNTAVTAKSIFIMENKKEDERKRSYLVPNILLYIQYLLCLCNVHEGHIQRVKRFE